MTGDGLVGRPGRPRAVPGQNAGFAFGFPVLSAALVAVISYVSLYPFRPRPVMGSAWQIFLRGDPSHADRFDILANILLYAPLGFCLARAFLGARTRTVPRIFIAVAIPTIAASLMSLGIELLQVYDFGRASSMWDFYSNATGALLGALAGAAIVRISSKIFPAVLLSCWIGFLLISPLTSPEAGASTPFALIAQALEMFGAWLGAAVLIESLVGEVRGRLLLAVLIGGTLGLPWLLTTNKFSAPDAAGLAGACAALFVRYFYKNATLPFVFFWLFVTLDALRPFHFADEGRHFGMVPFLSLIYASRAIVVSAILSKLFLYGTLLWTALRAGWPLGRTTLCGAVLVLVLRIVQVYLPGRTAEITDVCLLLLIAGAMKVMMSVTTAASGGGKSHETVANAAHREQVPRTGGILL